MIAESARAEDLFPGAAGLFEESSDRAQSGAARWLLGLVAVGVALLVGRVVVGWMNRNL